VQAKYPERRSTRGVSLIFVVVCAAALILVIYSCFQALLYFGGSQELRNAVDAAALNVAKRAVEVRVPPSAGYGDCADSTGSISLTGINRVWGKAALVNANVAAMDQEGQGSDLATKSGDLAYQYAQETNDGLYGSLTSKGTLGAYFNEMAARRSVKMLGANSTTHASLDLNWVTALVDRGAESNLSFSSQQLPGSSASQVPGVGKGSSSFIQGYQPFTINGKTFCFVPFHLNEMPHLISDHYFEINRSDRTPISGVVNTIPNAFCGYGAATANGTSSLMGATAHAVANPQRQYVLAIPHSFVSIQITNIAKWYVNDKQVAQTSYDVVPGTQYGVKNFKLPSGNTLNGYASLGNEYGGGGGGGGNLWQAFISMPGDYQSSLTKMVQRIQEAKPDYSEAQLVTLLKGQKLLEGVGEYIIYPNYQNSDATNPTIAIAGVKNVTAPWLNVNAPPEGSTKVLANEGPLKDTPNYSWGMLLGGNAAALEHWAILTGIFAWKPGTGFIQNLGEVKINHTTSIYFKAD
jgi:hypothetical protein